MKLTLSQQNDVSIAAIAGEFNADSVRKFNDVVSDAMDQECRDFVVDLSDITSIDSAGLEALTALQRQCEEQLGMVRFCGADDTLKKIFEITRLDQTFTLNDTIEEAMATFA